MNCTIETAKKLKMEPPEDKNNIHTTSNVFVVGKWRITNA